MLIPLVVSKLYPGQEKRTDGQILDYMLTLRKRDNGYIAHLNCIVFGCFYATSMEQPGLGRFQLIFGYHQQYLLNDTMLTF
jgi:hypothetical protein